MSIGAPLIRPNEKGDLKPPSRLRATNFPTLVATNARSPSLFGIRLPGYCLPLVFHKLLTVHRFLEASDTVVGESASHGRVGPHQCSEPERSVARSFLVPAKGFEAPKHLLARTNDVAIGLLRVRGACKRERGDGG
jgi:hypothetical protein